MKSKKLLAALVLIFFTPLAFAAGATKVAVLDLQAVVLMSNVGQEQMQKLEKNSEYAALMAQAENFESDLEGLDKQLQSEGLTWADSKKEEHVNKMRGVARDRQMAIEQLNRARESVFMQLLEAMEPAIASILEEIMSKEGIELVLDSKSAIHKVQAADISQAVVAGINKLGAVEEDTQ